MRLIATLSILLFLTACSGVTHKQISDTQDLIDKGIRYYGLSTYLLATPNNTGGVDFSINQYPDPTKLMSAKIYGYLSAVDSDMTFSHGSLGKATDKYASSTIPVEIVKAGTAALTSFLNEVKSNQEYRIPSPSVFKFVHNKLGEWLLVGSVGSDSLSITLVPQDSDTVGQSKKNNGE